MDQDQNQDQHQHQHRDQDRDQDQDQDKDQDQDEDQDEGQGPDEGQPQDSHFFGAPEEMCDRACCSDFVNLPDAWEDKAWSFNLTNDILPLFDRKKFWDPHPDGPVDGRTHKRMTEEQYEKISPALRLASRMLQDDCAVHFICTMTDGTLHSAHSLDSPELDWKDIDAAEPSYLDNLAATMGDITQAPSYQVTNETELPKLPNAYLVRRPRAKMDRDECRLRSRAILDSLAGNLWIIQFNKGDDPTTLGRDTHGIQPPWTVRPSPEIRKAFPRAQSSRIQLSTAHYQIHLDEIPPSQLYDLARVLVHECGHALHLAANGWRTHAVFYGNALTNESGFELETAIFGGNYEWYNMRDKYPHRFEGRRNMALPVLQHWPSIAIYAGYRGGPADFTRRGTAPGDYFASTVSRIPLEWLAKTCTDKFWDDRDAAASSSSLLNLQLVQPRQLVSWEIIARKLEKTGMEWRFCQPAQWYYVFEGGVCEKLIRYFDDKIMRITRETEDRKMEALDCVKVAAQAVADHYQREPRE